MRPWQKAGKEFRRPGCDKKMNRTKKVNCDCLHLTAASQNYLASGFEAHNLISLEHLAQKKRREMTAAADGLDSAG